MARYGVIDLGTNTFHLLIVEVQADGKLVKLHKERKYVSLAEESIHRIGDAAFQRAQDSILYFAQVLKSYEVKHVKAFGTSALRNASNASDLIQSIFEKTGIQIEVISGIAEANFIHKGVKQVVPFDDSISLIMDIGGGSVEFILCDSEQVLWSNSFRIGVAVLYNNFHLEEPMTAASREKLQAFLKAQLAPLRKALQTYPPNQIIGASGTFDVLVNLLESQRISKFHAQLDPMDILQWGQSIKGLTLEERLAIPDLPTQRASLIVVAVELLEYVIQLANPDYISVSSFAMKEGIISEMAQNF
jgi:exopolyphosphatase/guanosine-5'-triphosphate,3'-diphosphate pyrophosphatase